MKKLHAKILFNIDGTKLHESKFILNNLNQYDRVIFNFPHTGAEGSTAESVQSNQELLRNFFVSASLVIHPSAEIHVALRETTFYLSWDILHQAQLADLQLTKSVFIF